MPVKYLDNHKLFVQSDGKILDQNMQLKKASDSNGYRYVYSPGAKKSVGVHRLVALAFLGEPPNTFSVVNHINRVRDDNDVSNLEWVSKIGNIKHAIAEKDKIDFPNVVFPEIKLSEI